MKVYVNEKNEIKAVGTTTDTSLTEVEITDSGNPFATWSEERICCFKADIRNGVVYGYSPYVKTTIIDKIILAEKFAAMNSNVIDTQIAVADTYEQTMANGTTIIETQIAVAEVYELVQNLLSKLGVN